MNERKQMVDPGHRLSIRRQTELLKVARSTLYYTPVGESAQNLQLMVQMDQLFTGGSYFGRAGPAR